MAIDDATIIDALRRQLSLAAAKQVVAAGNLANLNTPGYRAREVSFADALDGQLAPAAAMRATHPGHLAGAPAEPATVTEARGLPSRRDGNNVQVDRELLAMTRASGDFAAAQTALAAKFRLVRYALNDGR
ncbi:MAG TPA: flagellar basal body rod protein FlgB [Vicinamibacterales bacterium]